MTQRRALILGAAAAAVLSGGSALAGQEARAQPTKPAARPAARSSPRFQAQRQAILPFAHSAFPYEGLIPETGKPFLDAEREGRRGHTSGRGGLYFADETYADRRTLLHVGAGYQPSARSLMVVFFHGNQARLERDVLDRQRVAQQFDESRFNGVLVAPQLAVDALDSSAGRFWEPDFFPRYLEEAARHLSVMTGRRAGAFRSMRLVLIGYSGGYYPLAYALASPGLGKRVAGVILLDGLYGELSRFEQWIAQQRRQAFFASAYGASTRAENTMLIDMLRLRGLPVQEGLPRTLVGGGVWFIPAPEAAHQDFMISAWAADPLRDLLERIR